MELMVTLAVAGVLATIAVPTMRTFGQNNRLTAAANDFLRSLQLARSEAIKRQKNVIVCASADALAAASTCSYGTFRSWIVVEDSNNNWQSDAGETVIERHEPIDSTVTVNKDKDGIQSYAPTGYSNPDGVKAETHNVVFCDSRGLGPIGENSIGRAMLITETGRGRVSRDKDEVQTALTLTGGTCP